MANAWLDEARDSWARTPSLQPGTLPSTTPFDYTSPYREDVGASVPQRSDKSGDTTRSTPRVTTKEMRDAVAAATVGILLIPSDRFRISRCYSRADKRYVDRFNVSMKYVVPTEQREEEAFIPREPVDYIRKVMLSDIDEFNNAYPHTSYFWQAQMVHYGMLALKGTSDCKTALSKAAKTDALKVPDYLVELEEDLMKVWMVTEGGQISKTTTQPKWAERHVGAREDAYQAALAGSRTNDRTAVGDPPMPPPSYAMSRPMTFENYTQSGQPHFNQSISRAEAYCNQFPNPFLATASHPSLPPLEAQFKEWTRTWFAASATNAPVRIGKVEEVLAQGKELERAIRTALTNNRLLPATTRSSLTRNHRELISSLEYGRVMASKLASRIEPTHRQAPYVSKTVPSYSSKNASSYQSRSASSYQSKSASSRESWTAHSQEVDRMKQKKAVLKAVVDLIDSGISALIDIREADLVRQKSDRAYQSTEVNIDGKIVESISMVEDENVNAVPEPVQMPAKGINTFEPSQERVPAKMDQGLEVRARDVKVVPEPVPRSSQERIYLDLLHKRWTPRTDRGGDRRVEEDISLDPSEELVPDVGDKLEEATAMQPDSQETQAESHTKEPVENQTPAEPSVPNQIKEATPTQTDSQEAKSESNTNDLIGDHIPPIPSQEGAKIRTTGRTVKKRGMEGIKAGHIVNTATRAKRKQEQDPADQAENKRAKVQTPTSPPRTRRSTRISAREDG